MLIPYDETLGVHPQAEGFTQHQVWDFAHTAPEQYPLLLHFPYFDLYRKQVVKQADLVLAMHLRGEAFTAEQKRANFDYYEPLTVRDSSLSACTQAVIAAEVGHLDLAYDYLGEAALMDLRDLSTTPATACTSPRWPAPGSRWSPGFGGLRDHDGTSASRRGCPTGWPGSRSRLFSGRRLRVEVTHETATYSAGRWPAAGDRASRRQTDRVGRQAGDPPVPGHAVPAAAQPAARREPARRRPARTEADRPGGWRGHPGVTAFG